MNARDVGAIGLALRDELVGRVAAIEWQQVKADLDAHGAADETPILGPSLVAATDPRSACGVNFADKHRRPNISSDPLPRSVLTSPAEQA